MKKGGVFDMESSRERSMGEGEVGVDTNSSLSCHVLWSFKELTLVPWLVRWLKRELRYLPAVHQWWRIMKRGCNGLFSLDHEAFLLSKLDP
ncbi:hypothetical protein YC2023_010092 [Brassica napus]